MVTPPSTSLQTNRIYMSLSSASAVHFSMGSECRPSRHLPIDRALICDAEPRRQFLLRETVVGVVGMPIEDMAV